MSRTNTNKIKIIFATIFLLASLAREGLAQTMTHSLALDSGEIFECQLDAHEEPLVYWSDSLSTVKAIKRWKLMIFQAPQVLVAGIDIETGETAFALDQNILQQNAQIANSPFSVLGVKNIQKKDSWGFPISGLQIKLGSEVILQTQCVTTKKVVGRQLLQYDADGTSYGKTKAFSSQTSATGSVAAEVCTSSVMLGTLNLPDGGFGLQKRMIQCRFATAD